jgi:hypothetical protein
MKILDKRLIESSLSMILRYISHDRPFAIDSAYIGINPSNGWNIEDESITKEEAAVLDKKAHDDLKEDLNNSKYGAIPLKSGYEKTDEESFFIPNCTYDFAFEMANKYHQQSMIWKDKDYFGIVYTINFVDDQGMEKREQEKGMRFKTLIRDGITFDPEVLNYAYSALKRGTKNAQRKFAFQVDESIEGDDSLYEKIIPSRTSVMVYRKLDFGYRRIT